MQHTDIATTLGIYTQPIEESVCKLVNAGAEDVMTAKEFEQAQPMTEHVQ